MNKTQNSNTVRRATWALEVMARRSFPAAVALLDSQDPQARCCGLVALEQQWSNQTNALSLVLKALDDPHDDVVLVALGALGSGKFQTDLALPALLERIVDKRSQVRAVAIQNLGTFGIEARLAIPRLLEATRDADATLRQKATNTLRALQSG